MKKRGQRGITIVALIITIVLIGMIVAVAVTQGTDIIKKADLQTLNTNMLLVQAKEKVISEKNSFDEQNNPFKGKKLSEISGSTAIDELKSQGIIQESDENYQFYYAWNQATLDELGLDSIELKSGTFFIVNYKTEDVIYSAGYKHTDKNTYYKLSDLINLK